MTANVVATETSARPARQANRALSVDLIDLIGALFRLEGEDRLIDRLVDHLIGGRSVRRKVSLGELARLNWIASETPCYSTSIEAAHVLARRRGYRLSVDGSAGGFRARVIHPSSQASQTVTAQFPQQSALLAITRLAIREHAGVL